MIDQERVSHLMTRVVGAVKDHCEEYATVADEAAVFDVLTVAAFMVSTVLRDAPSQKALVAAHKYFLDSLNTGLSSGKETKH